MIFEQALLEQSCTNEHEQSLRGPSRRREKDAEGSYARELTEQRVVACRRQMICDRDKIDGKKRGSYQSPSTLGRLHQATCTCDCPTAVWADKDELIASEFDVVCVLWVRPLPADAKECEDTRRSRTVAQSPYRIELLRVAGYHPVC